MSAVRPPRWPAVAFTGAPLLIALLPWRRNHGYLRERYDYGLVIAASGHLNLGKWPYGDFTAAMALPLMLSQRWPWWAAVVTGAAVKQE